MILAIENRLIYRPMRYPGGQWQPAGLSVEDVTFYAEDGVRLHGWFCPCEPDPIARGPGQRWCFLYFHGNFGNVSHRATGIAKWHAELNVDVFAIDYRGYGKSEGKPTEQGLYRDSRAAMRWLTEEKGIPPERIVIVGRSIGGAVAAELALVAPHAALILESTFTSMPDMVRTLYPWLPVARWLKTRYPTIERVAACTRPLLITHGTADTLVPLRHAHALYERAPAPKRLVEIEGAGHNDVASVGGPRYFGAVRAFLDDVRMGRTTLALKESVG